MDRLTVMTMRDHVALILSILYLAFGATLAAIGLGVFGAFWFLLGAVYAVQVKGWLAYARERRALREWKETMADFNPVLPPR